MYVDKNTSAIASNDASELEQRYRYNSSGDGHVGVLPNPSRLFPTELINNYVNVRGQKYISDTRAGGHGDGGDDGDGAEEDDQEEGDAEKRSQATKTAARATYDNEREDEGTDEYIEETDDKEKDEDEHVDEDVRQRM
jgi:hypothetical protein